MMNFNNVRSLSDLRKNVKLNFVWNYFNGFCFFADTFQALIQYPDVVTAQAAKLVSSNYSGTGFCTYASQLSSAYIDYKLCVLL
jgi:hypothetical protein